MSDWKMLENQLRSWTPRAPAATVRTRIFPAAEGAAWQSPASLGSRWAWLGPVMGCFLVLTVISGSHTLQQSYPTGVKDADWLSLAASNQSYAAYIMADFHSEQNSLQKELVQWTRPLRSSEKPRAFPLTKTNSLTR